MRYLLSRPPAARGGWGTANVSLVNNAVDAGSSIANAFDGDAATDLILANDANAWAAGNGTPVELTFAFTGRGNVRQVQLQRSLTFGSTANFAGRVALLSSIDGATWAQQGTVANVIDQNVAPGGMAAIDFGTGGPSEAWWRLRIWSEFGNRMAFARIILADAIGGPSVVVLS
ncbi:hypothetical protein GVO57_09335 [Sphingomonas changnyeongensis]|uniref:F5/8 type C domain-containing protein n=1 Tax=Sphingomonas changnyeongensis TaxID=2698679 RepID=A0A7Z2NX15_9SPHN|nr:hypothetical protein [Sphingomonas changnyeongensis]QHL90984.1 hypothetical protein GVO57_09335 [Sphingomonas changnyeongensis]